MPTNRRNHFTPMDPDVALSCGVGRHRLILMESGRRACRDCPYVDRRPVDEAFGR